VVFSGAFLGILKSIETENERKDSSANESTATQHIRKPDILIAVNSCNELDQKSAEQCAYCCAKDKKQGKAYHVSLLLVHEECILMTRI